MKILKDYWTISTDTIQTKMKTKYKISGFFQDNTNDRIYVQTIDWFVWMLDSELNFIIEPNKYSRIGVHSDDWYTFVSIPENWVEKHWIIDDKWNFTEFWPFINNADFLDKFMKNDFKYSGLTQKVWIKWHNVAIQLLNNYYVFDIRKSLIDPVISLKTVWDMEYNIFPNYKDKDNKNFYFSYWAPHRNKERALSLDPKSDLICIDQDLNQTTILKDKFITNYIGGWYLEYYDTFYEETLPNTLTSYNLKWLHIFNLNTFNDSGPHFLTKDWLTLHQSSPQFWVNCWAEFRDWLLQIWNSREWEIINSKWESIYQYNNKDWSVSIKWWYIINFNNDKLEIINDSWEIKSTQYIVWRNPLYKNLDFPIVKVSNGLVFIFSDKFSNLEIYNTSLTKLIDLGGLVMNKKVDKGNFEKLDIFWNNIFLTNDRDKLEILDMKKIFSSIDKVANNIYKLDDSLFFIKNSSSLDLSKIKTLKEISSKMFKINDTDTDENIVEINWKKYNKRMLK